MPPTAQTPTPARSQERARASTKARTSTANASWHLGEGHLSEIAGGDRYATSAQVLTSLTGDGEEAPRAVVAATGENFPDALVGAGTLAPLANGVAAPVALTRPAHLPAAVGAALGSPLLPLSGAYVMGSAEVVSDGVAEQVRTTISHR